MTIPTSIGSFPPLLWVIIVLLAVAAGLLVLDQIQRIRESSTIEKCISGVAAIALLFFLLAPFLRPQQRTVQRDLQADMDILNVGLTAFKVRFGVYPPSRVALYEQPDGWGEDARSRGIIKRIWPRFSFSQPRDLNRDGDTDDSIKLTGAECLVFFLGGIADHRQTSPDVPNFLAPRMGFSKDPSDPFKVDSSAVSSRDGPFYVGFDVEYLVDLDKDGFAELLPARPKFEVPYVYLSSYGGTGYQKRDVKLYPQFGARNLRSFYTTDTDGTRAHNEDSFQLICAGVDNLYGIGGHYQPEEADDLLTGDRAPERDNITNFHYGPLADP